MGTWCWQWKKRDKYRLTGWYKHTAPCLMFWCNSVGNYSIDWTAVGFGLYKGRINLTRSCICSVIVFKHNASKRITQPQQSAAAPDANSIDNLRGQNNKTWTIGQNLSFNPPAEWYSGQFWGITSKLTNFRKAGYVKWLWWRLAVSQHARPFFWAMCC